MQTKSSPREISAMHGSSEKDSCLSRFCRRLGQAPCYSCAPTLVLKGSDPETFEPTCVTVLAALSGESWSGRWKMSSRERRRLLEAIEKDDEVPNNDDGTLGIDEIFAFTKKPTRQEEIRKLPCSAHGILVNDLVKEAFAHFDRDGSGALDESEWGQFLEALADLHMRFLLGQAIIGFRAFFGRGQPWTTNIEDDDELDVLLHELRVESQQVEDDLSTQSKGLVNRGPPVMPTFYCGRDSSIPRSSWRLIPDGWWADLRYYSANYHALHSIFACDEENQLSWYERLAVEVATLALTMLTTQWEAEWVVQGHPPSCPMPFGNPCTRLGDPVVFSVVMVTLASMIFYRILYVLFVCPCGSVDESNSTPAEVRNGRWLQRFGALLGFCFVASGLFSLYLDRDTIFSKRITAIALTGRVRGYVLSWVLMLVLPFNPLVSWGQPNPGGSCSLGDLIGVGTWRIQKLHYQLVCCRLAHKLKADVYKSREIGPFANVKDRSRSFFRCC